jgi:hypothetical protein
MVMTDFERSVPDATKLLPDERVIHYWDPEKKLGEAYKPVLDLKQTVWDVYLLYPPDAEWKEQPPKPVYWMHQLGVEAGQKLNGEILAGEVKKLLESGKKQ